MRTSLYDTFCDEFGQVDLMVRVGSECAVVAGVWGQLEASAELTLRADAKFTF